MQQCQMERNRTQTSGVAAFIARTSKAPKAGYKPQLQRPTSPLSEENVGKLNREMMAAGARVQVCRASPASRFATPRAVGKGAIGSCCAICVEAACIWVTSFDSGQGKEHVTRVCCGPCVGLASTEVPHPDGPDATSA